MSERPRVLAYAAKPLKPAAAAARLNIAVADLPDLGRRWTRANVQRLRRERPAWLTAARREHAGEQDRLAAARRRELAAMLDKAGFTRPDDGSDDLVATADHAYMYLLTVKKIPDAEAQQAVDARWTSVAEYDFDEEFC